MQLIYRAFSIWTDHAAMRLAASVAYYTMMSFAPLLVVALKIAGLAYGHHAAEKVGEQVNVIVGTNNASSPGSAVHALLDAAERSKHGSLAAVISFVVALVSGSTLFASLQDALNQIWDVKLRTTRRWRIIVRNRLAASAMVLFVAIVLLASFALTAVLSIIVTHLGVWTTGLTYAGDTLASCLIALVLFGSIFKVLPDVKCDWSDIWLGATVAAVLFSVGKFALAVYFKFAAVESPFGAAGSLAALLIWVYYSAGLMFFGAAFTRALAESRGKQIKPTANAVAN